MWDTADWSHRGEYMYRRHGIAPDWADEALVDPERVVLEPGPSSKSGQGVRIVGYSASAEFLVTVIVLEHEGIVYGVNEWRANTTDLRRYREEQP